ncbi:MAG TPA: penicillin-binding protein 2 [Desulfobacteraceae bacterium]|nr:penicillin-binding protein 2 [Desulfobacteraceae bacterium]
MHQVLKPSHFDPVSSEIFSKQLKIAMLVVLMAFGILILRLWTLQIVNGPAYRAKSEHNRIRLHDIPPFRGTIMDRNSEVLVDNRPSYDLYVIPEEVQNRSELLDRLSRLGDLDREAAERILDKAGSGYPFKPVCLKTDISRDELASIESHRFDLPGLMIRVRPQRHYFYEGLASHVLGYVGEISEAQLMSGQFPKNRAGDLIGKRGVEWKWQAQLNGIRGGEQVEVDAAGRKIAMVSRKDPMSGANICLTIDKRLQELAEKSLQGKHGAIVAINPLNGEVLALASSPSFNPNVFIRGLDKKTWQDMVLSKEFPLQNRAISGQYPPGSVFKIVMALAALEEGVISPEEEIFCNGTYSLGKGTYRCWKKWGHGKVNLHRALVESCDVYFYVVGKRLGVDRIAQYAKRLGLGKETGLDLGEESSGLIPTTEWKLKKWGVPWQPGETISTSIGQSFVLTTPLQMANLISSVFNGGHIYRPQTTKWVKKSGGETLFEFKAISAGEAGIKPEHLELVKKALIGVVNQPHGTGSKARLKDIIVAGKTGTAQVIALKKEGGSKREEAVPFKFRDHAWFVAIAPASNPEIAVAVLVEHGGHGGSAAAPIARDIIQAYLQVPS